MSDVNSVALTGRLTRDPELAATPGGSEVLALPLAFSTGRRDRGTGEWVEETGYVDVAVFGNRARGLAGILRRGSQVAVSGRLRWSEWRAADGARRTRLSVVADEVVPPPRPRGAPAAAPAPQPSPAPAVPAAPASPQRVADGITDALARATPYDAYGDEISF